MLNEQLAQRLRDIVRLKPTGHHDRQALAAVLVQDILTSFSMSRPVQNSKTGLGLVLGGQIKSLTLADTVPVISSSNQASVLASS